MQAVHVGNGCQHVLGYILPLSLSLSSLKVRVDAHGPPKLIKKNKEIEHKCSRFSLVTEAKQCENLCSTLLGAEACCVPQLSKLCQQ